MTRILARRVRKLEAQRCKLEALWEGMSPRDQRAVLDAAMLTLIQQGVLPPPDPTRPDAPMDVFRREAADALDRAAAFRQWHEAYLGNRDWHQRHPEAGRAAVAALERWARPTGHDS